MAKARKIELPASLDQAVSIPEDAKVDEIAAMVEQAKADGAKALDNKNDPDRINKANWFIGAIGELNKRSEVLVAETAAEQETLDNLRNQLGVTGEGDGGEGGEGGEGGDGATGEHDDDDKDKPAPPVIAGDPAADAIAADPAAAPMLVASAGRGGRRIPVGRKQLVPVRPDDSGAYLTAGAGARDVEAGAVMDWAMTGKVASRKFDALPRFRGDTVGPRTQHSIGSVHMPQTDERLVAGAGQSANKDGFIDASEAIAWALSPERLRKTSGVSSDDLSELVAAGGWCAPSEVLYDLLDMTTAEGLIDIPGITVNRGGVKYSLGPNFAAVFNGGQNFTKTEAQTIAGSMKPVVNIPCPTFNEYRMLVDGMYLTGDILSQKGYPEAYADFTQKALKAFQHYVSMNTIADMVAASTAVDYTVGGTKKGTFAATTTLLGAIEMQIIDMRYANRLSLTSSVEVVLPLWVIGIIRQDLAKRQGVDNAANISDADIAGYFAQRNANVQFVYDWQDVFSGVSGGFGGVTPILAWPTTCQFLVYPTGTFVRALEEVIELNAVYDSLLLKTNQYVALFMEQGRLTLKRGWDARVVTVPVYATGATGAPIDYTSNTYQPGI